MYANIVSQNTASISYVLTCLYVFDFPVVFVFFLLFVFVAFVFFGFVGLRQKKAFCGTDSVNRVR